MRALNTVMAPLRASAKNRIAAWRDSLDDLSLARLRLADALSEARARRLIAHPPKALRIFANRYVLISLAAGACYVVIRRLRARRPAKPAAVKAKARRPARTPSASRRKSNGGSVRGAPVH